MNDIAPNSRSEFHTCRFTFTVRIDYGSAGSCSKQTDFRFLNFPVPYYPPVIVRTVSCDGQCHFRKGIPVQIAVRDCILPKAETIDGFGLATSSGMPGCCNFHI